jgi:hypothetical protein
MDSDGPVTYFLTVICYVADQPNETQNSKRLAGIVKNRSD